MRQQFYVMTRTHVWQFTLVHVAKCHSTISWIMSSYFPTTDFKQQYVHQQETIGTTVPLPDGGHKTKMWLMNYKKEEPTGEADTCRATSDGSVLAKVVVFLDWTACFVIAGECELSTCCCWSWTAPAVRAVSSSPHRLALAENRWIYYR